MDTNYASLAVEVLKAMYSHNSKDFQKIGDTTGGPEPLTAEQVAHDLRTIYNEMIRVESDDEI
ncbi:hypothetical protein [Metasolibacillus sp.]|uniref:hypothetical protein n=1 Tax=Metasolibacillus sp. TaxID=2703680 RepID=UPI0025F71498|nr:hypothetical protein [Metasolibacillus sp.]MCT6925277.1 hypothetical protein [Metasolibacillus sp.]MCT6941493.1 hypothetical protein [Metasolibacillus sp.]